MPHVLQDVVVLLPSSSEGDDARQEILDGFEVVQPPTAQLPGLAVKTQEPDSDENFSAIVEFAIAFGVDDIAPGFRVAGPSLQNFVLAQASEDEESKHEDDLLLCIRGSNDPLELSKRSVTSVQFISESAKDGFEVLSVASNLFSLAFRTVASPPLPSNSSEEAECQESNGQDDNEEEKESQDPEGNDNDENKDLQDQTEKANNANNEQKITDVDEDVDEEEEWHTNAEATKFEHADEDDSEMLDGELGECILPSAESKSNELEEAERRAQAARISELIEKAKAEREALTQTNGLLQRDLAALIQTKQTLHKGDGLSDVQSPHMPSTSDLQTESFDPEMDHKYKNALSAYRDASDTLRRTQESYDTVAMQLQSKLDIKEKRCDEIQTSFAHFKREIAKQAENSRSGKPIPVHIIDQFESAESSKSSELEKIRLRNLHLRAELNKLEKALQNKERLADGLHLIDFEQLKIENQALSEKIEERNEDLAKLNKKTTTTVQVLTHLKEKLVYVQAEAVQLGDELKVLDRELQSSRDQLNQSKRQRDHLRSLNSKKREGQGFFKSTLLVEDYKKRTHEIKALQRSIQDLQQKHANLTAARHE